MDALCDKKHHYTYADYCKLDDERCELIDGAIYAMSPAPEWKHQRYSGRLFLQLASFLKGKTCEVFSAPFDVRLNANSDDNTVVQPDIVVICDHSKLSGTGCVGAPDLVVEILSPTTSIRDRTVKLNLYLQAGVQEYWIVDPEAKTVHAHVLESGRYFVTCYIGSADVPVHVLDGCTINLPELFD